MDASKSFSALQAQMGFNRRESVAQFGGGGAVMGGRGLLSNYINSRVLNNIAR